MWGNTSLQLLARERAGSWIEFDGAENRETLAGAVDTRQTGRAPAGRGLFFWNLNRRNRASGVLPKREKEEHI